MIKYVRGTVFNANTQAIVNTVNCVGVMGTGIALEFKLRYPKMYNDYEVKCKEKKIVTGRLDYYKNQEGPIIVNFPTKRHFKYPSQLIWIEQGLQDFVKTYQKNGITSIAFPKLGTGKGGLIWDEVKMLMENYLSDIDIDVYVCLDCLKEAAGVEKEMLHIFNGSNFEQLSRTVKLNEKQLISIQKNVPYNRFWKILDTEHVGMKTYTRLFDYCYKVALGDMGEEPNQLSLFNSNFPLNSSVKNK